MASKRIQRPESPESKSDASASGAGITPTTAMMPKQLHEQIEKRAYELAEQRGFTPGQEIEDWLQAEREIEAGPARNTAPDNPFDTVRTSSNEKPRPSSGA
jgi:Protein of unknown function (DUF2934)